MKVLQLQALALAGALGGGRAFSQDGPQPVSRRDALAGAFSSIGAAAAVAAAPRPARAAVPPCPAGSNNCVRRTWTPPAGTSAADAAGQLRDALNAYPPGGLEGGKVDGGGYAIVGDALPGGAVTLEYRSSGKGTFAKLFNGGKPFVDDLVAEAAAGGAFEVRSASRVGDSDFGVNGKRLDYLAGLLRDKGWSAE